MSNFCSRRTRKECHTCFVPSTPSTRNTPQTPSNGVQRRASRIFSSVELINWRKTKSPPRKRNRNASDEFICSALIVHKGRILLGVANALGFLQIYQLEKSEVESLTLLSEIRISNEDECLALSLDWCSGRWTNETESNLKIVVSDSTGFVSIIEVEDSLRKSCSWKAHDFEAWIAAFDYWDTNVIYTGGDDCKFQRFDERIGDRVTVGNRVHGSGVTSIHSNGAREHLLCTGSYDEILRLWDTRNLARPISQTNLTGGVWRLKWDPFARRYLLAACMYGGFKLVDTWETEAPSIIAEYTEHESIAYGCDWSFSTEELNPREDLSSMELLIGTCSFYDHVLKLSALALPAT